MEIDFTKLKVNPLRMYGGASGNKIGILYQGETYMRFLRRMIKERKEQIIDKALSRLSV